MVNEALVAMGQCCGMSYLKMYEQYMLSQSIQKEKLTNCLPYETDSTTAIL